MTMYSPEPTVSLLRDRLLFERPNTVDPTILDWNCPEPPYSDDDLRIAVFEFIVCGCWREFQQSTSYDWSTMREQLGREPSEQDMAVAQQTTWKVFVMGWVSSLSMSLLTSKLTMRDLAIFYADAHQQGCGCEDHSPFMAASLEFLKREPARQAVIICADQVQQIYNIARSIGTSEEDLERFLVESIQVAKLQNPTMIVDLLAELDSRGIKISLANATPAAPDAPARENSPPNGKSPWAAPQEAVQENDTQSPADPTPTGHAPAAPGLSSAACWDRPRDD